MPAQNNPYLDACPDFSLPEFAERRDALTHLGWTDAQAVAFLKAAWVDVNNTAKARWDQAIAAEEQAAADAERERLEAAAAASAAQAQEQEALEKEDRKKNAAKYLPHSDNPVPSGPPIIPSAAVLAKLKKGEYVPLWHFTRAGLKAVDRSTASEDKNSGRLTTDAEGALVWTPILDSKIARGVVADRDLSFEEFTTAAPRLLQAMVTAGWPTQRVSMFHAFFTAIQRHAFWTSLDERDQHAIMLYEDGQRQLWHTAAATATLAHPVYSLAVINEDVLRDAWHRVDVQWYDDKRERVRGFCSLILD
ncbi:hypothetical protein BJ912DRAFT_853214 [Pholiota molesta]|nr:hypothetical protein BJ912DRAFT_853214 [Pholiota molesta]